MNNKYFNAKHEARRILSEHTEAMISGIHYEPDNSDELYDMMIEECAFILTEALLDGKYTPMQYNAIRNELGEMLYNLFANE